MSPHFAVHLFSRDLLSDGYMKEMHRALLGISTENIKNCNLVKTDLSNEVTHNMYLINKTILLFRKILDKTDLIGARILNYAEELVVISTETSSTAVEQSTGVKEIVSTMEDADKLSQNISEKIKDVTLIASKTSEEVQQGFEALNSSIDKMHQISDANLETISEIKQLNDKID